MSNGGSALMFLGGAVAVIGIGYYMHQAGYFNQIFDAINKAIEDIKKTKPANGNGGNGKPKCTGGKIECKDGKCDTQAKCDSQAKCKSGEHWSASAKKCEKTSSLALAYVTPQMGDARYRAYRLYYNN